MYGPSSQRRWSDADVETLVRLREAAAPRSDYHAAFPGITEGQINGKLAALIKQGVIRKLTAAEKKRHNEAMSQRMRLSAAMRRNKICGTEAKPANSNVPAAAMTPDAIAAAIADYRARGGAVRRFEPGVSGDFSNIIIWLAQFGVSVSLTHIHRGKGGRTGWRFQIGKKLLREDRFRAFVDDFRAQRGLQPIFSIITTPVAQAA